LPIGKSARRADRTCSRRATWRCKAVIQRATESAPPRSPSSTSPAGAH
jgi:hypothetical protein